MSTTFFLVCSLCAFFVACAAPTKGTVPVTCHLRQFNLMFAVDTSHSITDPDFRTQMKYVNSIIDGLKTKKVRVNAGVVTFGVDAKTDIGLDHDYNSSQLKETINNIPHRKEFGSNAHLGMHLARLELDDQPSCCGVMKAVILVTDGFPSYQKSAYIESKVTVAERCNVFLVAVGDSQGETVEMMAALYTNGDKSRVIQVKEAGKLDDFVDTMIKALCVGNSKPGYSASSPKPTHFTQKEYNAVWPLLG